MFSCSIMCNSLWLHGLQHTRLPCPSPSSEACSNSSILSQGCHLTIPSFVVPFSFCFQSFPASGSFLMSLFFSLSGQSIGASASASGLLMNIQDWFPLGLTDLISLQSKGLSSPGPQFESTNSSVLSLLCGPALTSVPDYWKNTLDYYRLLSAKQCLCFLVHCLGLS